MPVILSVDQLEAGMVLADNLVQRFTVLLPAGKTLSASDIDVLVRKFPAAEVTVSDPVLDESYEFDEVGPDRQMSLDVRGQMTEVLQKVFNNLRSGLELKSVNLAKLNYVIDTTMERMLNNRTKAVMPGEEGDSEGYLVGHSANVYYLSMAIGAVIRNYIKKERERQSAAKVVRNAMNLKPLGTAAVLHDIGMVPIEHVYRTSKLEEKDIASIKAHPRRGAEMLPPGTDGMVNLVVRTHHESQNGKGYPEGLVGDKINIFARIVRVADAYCAAVAQRTYRKAKNPVLALHEMLYGDYRPFYDPIILKVFSMLVQPFPIGAKIGLEDGRQAVVCRQRQGQPFRPEVVIAFDENDKRLPESLLEEPFNLGERTDVRICTFAGADISYLNELEALTAADNYAEDMERAYSETFDLAYP